jgi:hypothetical protein
LSTTVIGKESTNFIGQGKTAAVAVEKCFSLNTRYQNFAIRLQAKALQMKSVNLDDGNVTKQYFPRANMEERKVLETGLVVNNP